MLASSGERIPPLGGAGQRVLEHPGGRHDPRLQERPDQCKDPLVLDPPPHPVQQRRVPDLVETRLDVGLQHPLMRVAAQKMDLSEASSLNRGLPRLAADEPARLAARRCRYNRSRPSRLALM
jgi:hypothetical protein